MYTGLTPHHLQPTAVLYTGFTVLAKSKSASLSTVSLAKQYIFSKCKKIHCVSSVLTMSAGHKQRHLVHNSPACRLLQLSKELPLRPAVTALPVATLLKTEKLGQSNKKEQAVLIFSTLIFHDQRLLKP